MWSLLWQALKGHPACFVLPWVHETKAKNQVLNGLMLGSQPSRTCYRYVLGDSAIHRLFNELKFLINCIITPHQTFPNSLVHHMVLDIKPPAWNQGTGYLKSRRFRKDLPQGAWAHVSCSLAAAYSVEMKSPSGFLERQIPVPSRRKCARGSQDVWEQEKWLKNDPWELENSEFSSLYHWQNRHLAERITQKRARRGIFHCREFVTIREGRAAERTWK